MKVQRHIEQSLLYNTSRPSSSPNIYKNCSTINPLHYKSEEFQPDHSNFFFSFWISLSNTSTFNSTHSTQPPKMSTSSSPQFFTYPGYGERATQNGHMTQSVRLGSEVQISGQGGWDRSTDKISRDLTTQIEQAFENVDVALKAAGSKGWEEVFAIRSYSVPMDEEMLEILVATQKKWCGERMPIWTAVGVPRLALDGMKVEIEVRAWSPQEGRERKE